MKIIISPAKKMNRDTDTFPIRQLPYYLPEAEALMDKMKGMTYEELRKLWKCNDSIARLNHERLLTMDLRRQLTPAVIAYEGIQYQYMAPLVMEEQELEYLEKHLCILSGFYGILRPFDGVVPYRLEMQAKFPFGEMKSLYDYWGSRLYDFMEKEEGAILNLASKEYSKCILRYCKKDRPFVTCVFGEMRDGRVIEKGTLAKMARGEMVRFLAENQIKEPEGVKEFSGQDYRYVRELSDEKTYVFIKEGTAS